MLIKSIKLRNFRQFKGVQRLDFAVDVKCNVTLVMGATGSGKTTLAQAFSWCLYGVTDAFTDKSVYCNAVVQAMQHNIPDEVSVDITIEHRGNTYIICRSQRFKKEYGGRIREEQTVFHIGCKTPDGQTKSVLNPDLRIKEILPRELSRYFFFDGERLENMRNEIGKGRSKEFPAAVRSLLGLDAIKEAIDHLAKVIRRLDESFDPQGDSTIRDYARRIKTLNEQLEKVSEKLSSMRDEEEQSTNRCNELRQRIEQNIASKELAEQKSRLEKLSVDLIKQQDDAVVQMLNIFKRDALDFYAAPWMQAAIKTLKESEKLDTGIPDIHERTLDYLLERGICLCGTDLAKGSLACKEINKLRDFIPPKSIGTMLDQFVSECLLRSQRSESLFGQFEHHYSIVRNHAKTYGDNENAIKNLIEKLKGLEDIGHMQVDLSRLEQHLYTLRSEREGLIREVGSKETDRQRLETERSGFALKSKANRKIETHKAYAQAMYDILKSKYTHRENEIRKELSEKVDTIFRRIYKGGLSLTLDENYNIVLNVIDCDGWCSDKEIDTSTGQGYAVILGFIGGVIEMARKNRESDELAAEAYPLVMDAPLSAFDKIRIQTVCDELPRVAEQVVIFIKDTDGELAEQHLCARVGKRYTVEKKNELESVLREGKHNG